MNHQNSAATPDADELRAFILEFNSVWNEHKFDQAGDYYAESFMLNGVRRTLDSFNDQVMDLIDTFPDRSWHVEHVVVEGDLVCVLYTITGTHLGVHEGIAPTGRKFRTSELAHYRVLDGRIVEEWYVYDDTDLKRQLTQS